MDAMEAQGQIKQMINFILAEAQDKSAEIAKKGEEEFSIEVHKIVTEQKEKIRQTYERKTKQIETKYAIAKSLAINKQRLEKIKARQEVMTKITEDSKVGLVKGSQDKAFVSKLITQGLLMFLEQDVKVRCREADVKLVETCLGSAADDYAKTIKTETGTTRTCTVTIDKSSYLPAAPSGKEGASCLGGIALSCAEGKITIDNTIDARLNLVMEQDKPAIRKSLFGSTR